MDAQHWADHLSSATGDVEPPVSLHGAVLSDRGDSGLAVARFSRWSGAEWSVSVLVVRKLFTQPGSDLATLTTALARECAAGAPQ